MTPCSSQRVSESLSQPPPAPVTSTCESCGVWASLTFASFQAAGVGGGFRVQLGSCTHGKGFSSSKSVGLQGQGSGTFRGWGHIHHIQHTQRTQEWAVSCGCAFPSPAHKREQKPPWDSRTLRSQIMQENPILQLIC